MQAGHPEAAPWRRRRGGCGTSGNPCAPRKSQSSACTCRTCRHAAASRRRTPIGAKARRGLYHHQALPLVTIHGHRHLKVHHHLTLRMGHSEAWALSLETPRRPLRQALLVWVRASAELGSLPRPRPPDLWHIRPSLPEQLLWRPCRLPMAKRNLAQTPPAFRRCRTSSGSPGGRRPRSTSSTAALTSSPRQPLSNAEPTFLYLIQPPRSAAA